MEIEAQDLGDYLAMRAHQARLPIADLRCRTCWHYQRGRWQGTSALCIFGFDIDVREGRDERAFVPVVIKVI